MIVAVIIISNYIFYYIILLTLIQTVNNGNDDLLFIRFNDEADIRRVTDAHLIGFEHPQQDCDRLSSVRSSCTTSSRLSSRRVPGMQTITFFYPLHSSCLRVYMCHGQVSFFYNVLIFLGWSSTTQKKQGFSYAYWNRIPLMGMTTTKENPI